MINKLTLKQITLDIWIPSSVEPLKTKAAADRSRKGQKKKKKLIRFSTISHLTL